MPRLMATADDQIINIPGPGNFQFSAVRIEDLGASEYTLASIIVDISGSVNTFADSLLNCIKSIIGACKKSPRAENLLIRLLTFNDKTYEIHGFKKLSDIDVNTYQNLNPEGMTALFDATYDGTGATLEYSKQLIKQDFDCNGALYIITDGMDNRSKMTPTSIKEKIELATHNEEIESLISILIGVINPKDVYAQDIRNHLEKFKADAGLTQFVDMGEATSQRLAKLAGFVSQSISSQSQAVGSGAPSQTLNF